MKYEDLEVALGFLDEHDMIVVQHSFKKDRHLLIRYILQKWGLASRNDYDGLRYGDKYIQFEITTRPLSGIRKGMPSFFISRIKEELSYESDNTKADVLNPITGYWAGW